MGLFKKKKNVFGLEKDKDGNLFFNLTEEEKREIENTFNAFKDMAVRSDLADDMQRGVTAHALAQYADGLALKANIETDSKSRLNFLENATAAITKAYSINQLPVYLYDLASFLEMQGKIDMSKNLFRDFLNKQSTFKANQVDEILLKERDIEEVIKDAEEKVLSSSL